MPAWTRYARDLPANPPTAPRTTVAGQERRGEEPDDEADAGAALDALAAEVVAGLLDVHLALAVLDDKGHAWFQMATLKPLS